MAEETDARSDEDEEQQHRWDWLWEELRPGMEAGMEDFVELDLPGLLKEARRRAAGLDS